MYKTLHYFSRLFSYKTCAKFLIIILTILLITEFSKYPKASTIKYTFYQQTPVVSDNLEVSKELNQQIDANKTHFYKVDLVEGQYIKVLVEQKGADLEVKLLDANDKLVVMTDNPFGQQGTEVLEAIIKVSGSYKIELINNSPKEGNYTIKLKELRMASSKDKVLVTERFLAEKTMEMGRDLYQNQKNILKALETFEKALLHCQASENKALEAETLNEIGRMYYLLGKSQEAINYYNKVLAITPTMSDPIAKGAMEAASYNNIGQVAGDKTNYQEAFDNYKKAYDISSKLNLEDQIAKSINNLANVYMFFEDLDQAIKLYEEALIIHQQTGNLNSQAVVLNNLGSAHYYLNKLSEAENLYKQAIDLNNEDFSTKASALRNLGVLYAKQEKIEQTLENYQSALEVFQKLGAKSEEGYTLMLLGEVYHKNFATYNNLKALVYLNKALPLLRSDNRNLPLANTLRLLAEVQFEIGDFIEAQKNIEQAIELITFTRKNILNPEFRQNYAEIVQNSYALYISLLMKQHLKNPTAGYDVKAFEVSEQARARNLLELLAQSHIDIKYGVSKELVDKEQNLRRKLQEQQFSLIKLANNKLEDSEDAKTVKKEQEKTLRELREVLVEIKQQNPSFIALPEAKPLGLEAIQKQILDPESLILEYFLGETESYLWVISQTNMVSYVLPSRKKINNLAQEVYQLLSTKGKPKTSENLVKTAQRFSLKQINDDDDRVYWQKAKELSQVLLPNPEQFKEKRLVIVPDESLHYIPFGALPLNSIPKINSKKNNQLVPLLQTNEIVNLPSVSIITFLKQNPKQQILDKKILVIADPVFSLDDPRFNIESVKKLPNPKNEEISSVVREQNFTRLIASLKEANLITSLIDENRFKKFLSFETTKANFLAENLTLFRFIHFATHAQINNQNPELSKIVFSLFDKKGELQNGFLSLYEIYNLRLQADLVVLSTCQSALGKELKAEGIVGLTQGFMTAGASRVISSLWNVNDSATAKLMENFYKKVLKENKTPSQALRLAQIELSKDERFKSPYLWAPFVLQGKWN
ncbi:MAG: CHAT domain-containing protein [Acidobacteria bacterium]|nr:CHAT domain-containing protein [Acidobacteriota bacterium]